MKMFALLLDLLTLVVWFLFRHEAELAAAAAQPLPDDDDEAFD